MNFSEAQLVDLFIKDRGPYTPPPFGRSVLRVPKYKIKKYAREYRLPSGQRCDLVGFSRSQRVAIILEFKIHADPYSLAQVIEYREEMRYFVDKESSFASGAFGVIVAQYFKEETLLLARHLGIGALHMSPINSQRSKYDWLVYPNFKQQHGNHDIEVHKWHRDTLSLKAVSSV